jgi:competence protein ComEC
VRPKLPGVLSCGQRLHNPWLIMSSPFLRRATAGSLIAFLLLSCILTSGCLGGFPGTILPVPHSGENEGKLRAYFLDVGQGDSTIILFGNRTLLIDAGEIDKGDRVVSKLKKLGVTKIDLLVATHPHSDHIGGMEEVLTAFPVGEVLDSGMPASSSLYEHFLETVDRKKIPYRVAEQGENVDLDPSLRILVLSPPEERLGEDLNTNSVMLRVSYGTVSFLFTGDAGENAELALLRTGYPLDAQILKVAHHGSSDATSPAFLDLVHPETAVISVGKDNPYGHPHEETLASLEEAGAALYRTDRDGTILVQSDGSSYSVKTETGGDIWPKAIIPSQATLSPAPASLTPVPVIPANRSPAPLPVLPAVTIVVPDLSLPAVQIGNASSIVISATQFNAPGTTARI